MSILLRNLFIKNKFGIQSLFKCNFSTKNISYKPSNIKNIKLFTQSMKHFTIANLRGNLAEQEEILLKTQRDKLTNSLNYVLSEMKNKQQTKNQLPIEKILEMMDIVDKSNEEIRQDAEIFLLEIMRDPQLYKKYFEFPEISAAHNNFSQFFLLAPRIRILEEKDLIMLKQIFNKMDNKVREFSIDDRIKLYDAFYYYFRNFGEDLVIKTMGDMHDKIVNSFLEFFTSFTHTEVTNLLKNIVYLEDKKIQNFVNRMKDKLLYVFNEEYGKKLGLSLNKKFDLIQFYPRILFSIRNTEPELFEKEKEKMETFLIESSNDPNLKDLSEEMILCVISNYLVWTSRNEKVFECYMKYFYNHLSSFRNELLLELFFLLLHSDFKAYKNIKLPVSMLNLIYQLIKNLKPDQFAIFDDTKDVIYFKKIRTNLIENFDKWDAKNPADSQDNPDYYHKKIIREFIKKSIDMYPFASIDYSEEGFDRIYENLKNHIKF